MNESSNWALGILDADGKSWFAEQDGIVAVPMDPGRPINKTHVALIANFNTGSKRYQVVCVYDPLGGTGRIRLNVEPFESVE